MDGWRVPGFTELRELGAGAQGRAVLVREDASERPAVLKYVFAPTDPAALERFRRESVLLKRVNSPYVARWFGHFEEAGGAAILMEAIDGVSLKEILVEHAPLTPEAALTVLKGSLLGLAAAHAAGVVHKDYKPANVVVPADGRSKLIDFGVAALAGHTGSRSGTPAYMAPEQWRGAPADPATDVYAATCVFFECVTSHRPYHDTDLSTAHVTAAIPAEEVAAPLRPLIIRGLAKDPADRPPSAEVFARQLETTAREAYGPDWELRGAQALAVAAVAFAAVFPLTMLTLAQGSGAVTAGTAAGAGSAAGSAAAQGSGTAAVQASGSVLAKVAGAKVALAVAGAVAGTTIVAGAVEVVVITQRKPAATRSATPRAPAAPAISAGLVSYSETIGSNPSVQVRASRIARVTGMRDTALQGKINKALRGPLDYFVERVKPNPADPPCVQQAWVQTKAVIIMDGPRMVSARYSTTSEFCAPSDGVNPDLTVNVDLRSGNVLDADDIFLPSTLTPGGLKTLRSRLTVPDPPSKAEEERCRYLSETFERSFFDSGRPRQTDTPTLHPMFSTNAFIIVSSTEGSDCVGPVAYSAPYAKIRDLLKPEVVALALARQPSPARS